MSGTLLATPSTLADNHTTALVLMASNASGYQEDNDFATTAGLTEKQRIVLACVTALLLAVCAIIIGFVLRRLMSKTSNNGVYTVEANFPLWRKRSDANSDDAAACAISQQRAASLSATNASQLKDLEAGGGHLQSDANETWRSTTAGVTSSVEVTANGSMTSSNSGHTVITMTMHNNHLIVETEEPDVAAEAPPPLTTTAIADPSNTTTTTTAAVCNMSTPADDVTSSQPVLVHQEAAPVATPAPPETNRPRQPSVSMALAGTGLSQAVDDEESEEGRSPRHPYSYGGGQAEYGCQATTVSSSSGCARRPALSSSRWRPPSHCQAYYKFQVQPSQDVVDTAPPQSPPAATGTAT